MGSLNYPRTLRRPFHEGGAVNRVYDLLATISILGDGFAQIVGTYWLLYVILVAYSWGTALLVALVWGTGSGLGHLGWGYIEPPVV